MKLKHFSGYGCINAKKLHNDKNTLTIEVSGAHECGLDRSNDKYDVFNWLVKRFDKKRKDYMEISDIDVDLSSRECKTSPLGYEDICVYHIHFYDR